MRRSARPKSDDRISLFPFLAVLICTMGALLVLLVVMSQHAQATASKERAERSEEERANAQRQLEDFQMWSEQWDEMKARTKEDLEHRRAQLAHIEDHMRRLRTRMEEIKAAQTKLASDDPSTSARADELERELERIRQELADAEKQLEEANKRAQKQASFAIIPYEGAQQTRRRPIYIECRSDGVILQPDGIRLEERDFLPPLGPANPLVSAIRAASAHWIGMAVAGHNVGDPYPLLLVRPDGIDAYYAARAAMKSWETDFGYELVGTDMDLEYPATDPRLTQAAEEAVAAARRRRAGRGFGGLGQGSGSGSGRSGSNSEGDYAQAGGSYGQNGEGEEDGGHDIFGDHQRKSWNRSNPDGSSRESSESANGESTSQPMSQTAGQAADGPTGTSGVAGGASAAAESIAESRGKNWASPGASKGLIPFTRTMGVQVAGDRLIILPQDPSGVPTTVMMQGSTKDGVEEFVSQVWEEMKGWGSAGRGMYWRPEIHLQVYPGGEQRARDLEVLLKNSGLELATPAAQHPR